MKTMTCQDFADTLWNEGFFSELNSEAYWNHDFNSDRHFEAMKDEAVKRGITLSDMNDWNYDKCMHDFYKSDDDKGLS